MTPADLAAAFEHHLRLSVLRALADAPGLTLNESVLTDYLPTLGLTPSRDRIRGALAWLAEQGLIAPIEDESLMVARLTGRGEDVARGRATHPGVKRPSADSIMRGAALSAASLLG